MEIDFGFYFLHLLYIKLAEETSFCEKKLFIYPNRWRHDF